ncbi:MAG: hypothetical protein PUF55_04665 [Bacteroidales bacterium]|nr:hypothetical protein [Bacteroidales bacterium]
MVSCKDYDDDIKSLKDQVDANAKALSEAKAALESEIASLKTQLETKGAEINQLRTDMLKATGDNATAIAKEIDRALAAEAALEVRLSTAEKTLVDLKNLIDTKVDQKTFDDAVKEIYGRLESVEKDLGKALKDIEALQKGLSDELIARDAADKNLQLQIDALNAYKKRVEDNEAAIKALNTTVAEHTKKIDDIIESIELLKKDIQANADSIDELTNKLNTINETVIALNSDVAVLKVLVNSRLTSLVFNPVSYYYGVEATEANTLEYKVWALGKANADEAEENYDSRVTSTKGSTALPVVAEYYMNPSSADLSKLSQEAVSVVSDDKDFVLTRGAAAGINVASWKAEDGMLKVTLKFNDPAAIKSVLPNQKITVFSTRVNLKGADKFATEDMFVESDFAALYKNTIKNVAIAVIDPVSKKPESNCDVECNPAHQHPHIYDTEKAAADADAQYTVVWNTTKDLSEIVEVHYNDGLDLAEGKKFTADELKKYGLELKYELVGFFLGNNKTSESAHAAINGSILRPQSPVFTEDHTVGKAAAYGATEQKEITIGREPMVRVSLVDTNNENRVIEYGYIKVKIIAADDPEAENKPADKVTMKDFAPVTYNYECKPAAIDNSLVWSQIEAQIYDLNGMSRDEFDENFEADQTTNGDFRQYDPETLDELTSYIGTINRHLDPGSAMTEVAQWTIVSNDVKALLSKDTYAGKKISVAFRFTSKHPKVYGDIYVILSTGTVTINKPSATGLDNADKIKENWYATNSSVAASGYDEVHAQTYSPEDEKETQAKTLNYNIYNVFVGNQITITGINDKTAGKEFADANLTKTVFFSDQNVGKAYKGILNSAIVEYTIGVSTDKKELQVTAKNGVAITPVTIAKIVNDAVKYQHTEEGEAMLNYKAHNELADDVLTAIMEVSAKNACFDLPLDVKTWNVRFLRPINPFSNNAEITDAGTKAQVINLFDIVKFTDWRDQWKPESSTIDYYEYYNIKNIEIVGAAANTNIAANVKTNLNQAADQFVTLSSVTNKIELTYAPKAQPVSGSWSTDYGTITYTNHGNTVGTFKLQLPLVITYEWGKVYTTVEVTVNGTIGGNS